MDYHPGNCNIGDAEIRRRYIIGYTGTALAITLIIAVHVAQLPREARLLLVFPVGIAAAGFVQGLMKFCLAYGFRGVFSTKGLRKLSRVTASTDRKADLKTAAKSVAIITVIAILVTTIYYLLP